jgi:hypothetical protein
MNSMSAKKLLSELKMDANKYLIEFKGNTNKQLNKMRKKIYKMEG